MTRRTLMLLVATAMAVLLAGCGSSQKEDQGSGHGGSQREVGSSQQTSEPTTNETSVGRCADSGGTGQQEGASRSERSEVSNGRIAFSRTTSNPAGAATSSDIYVIDEEGAHETRLTPPGLFEEHPVWSPDGQKIAFTRGSSGAFESGNLYVMNADGTNQSQIAGNVSKDHIPSWSPDGQKIAFIHEDAVQGLSDIYVINADGTNEARLTNPPISGNQFGHVQLGNPVWSPDGDKIAFASSTLKRLV